jgi:hypothetical protein
MNRSKLASELGKLGFGIKKTMTPEAVLQRQNAAKRKSRLAAARKLGTHTDREWKALLKEVNRQCVRCGNFGIPLTKDHIVRLGNGGSDAISNIQPMCRACNAAKTNEEKNWLAYRRAHGWGDTQGHFGFPKKPKALSVPSNTKEAK